MRPGTIYRAELFSRLGIRSSGERVLDIGAFDGHWISSQRGSIRVAVDLDVRANPNCCVVRGDGHRLPFPSHSFDSVFAFEVIEHVDDDAAFVSELIRVTRPGGRITLSTPSADMRMFPPMLTPWAHRRWGHLHCTGYRPEHLRRLFLDAGAQGIEVRPLRSLALRATYLPLSLVAHVSQRLAESAFRCAARIDSVWKTDGHRGYLLAQVVR
jgi:SAM-dependent methyltransferase